VFAGLFPVESNQYEALRDALTKLQLNDSAMHFEPEVSQALGFGFRCGFLGLLHMDIVQERLEREYGMDLITTAPSVVYDVLLRDGTLIGVDNPSRMPDRPRSPKSGSRSWRSRSSCEGVRGCGDHAVHQQARRADQPELPRPARAPELRAAAGRDRARLLDRLKSVSRGYASMDYELRESRPADVAKVDLLINGDRVDALSVIVHRSNAARRARELGVQDEGADSAPDVRRRDPGRDRLDHHRPGKHQGLRKNVLASVRWRHHAQAQAAGEAEGRQETMKQVGSVEIPQEAFLAILQVGGLVTPWESRRSDLLHPFLAGLLLLQQLALARDVAHVTLGQHVLPRP